MAEFELDADEGVAYLQVEWTGNDEDDAYEGGEGWVEVYQEGHRLMANFSGREIAIAVGRIDTYLWASVYDSRGRWVSQSNVLHTGPHAGVSVVLDDTISRQVWVDGDKMILVYFIFGGKSIPIWSKALSCFVGGPGGGAGLAIWRCLIQDAMLPDDFGYGLPLVRFVRYCAAASPALSKASGRSYCLVTMLDPSITTCCAGAHGILRVASQCQ